ncbi:MAG: PAS domain S-box protein [Candidatus Zixiibacteriota bacterium]
MSEPKKLKLLKKTASTSSQRSRFNRLRGAERTRRIIDSITDPVLVTDNTYSTVECLNEAGERLFGFSSADVTEKAVDCLLRTASSVIPDSMGPSGSCGGNSSSIAVRGRTRDRSDFSAQAYFGQIEAGEQKLCVITLLRESVAFLAEKGEGSVLTKPVQESGSSVPEASGFAQRTADLTTDRRRFSEYEDGFRELAAVSPDAICVHADGKILFANAAAVRLFGAAGENDLVGKPVLDFIHPVYHRLVEGRLAQLNRDKKPTSFVEQRIVRLDGETVDIEAAAAAMVYNGQPAVQVVARDITQRKKSERALRASQDLYRSTIDSMADMIHVVDRSLKITLINKTFSQWCKRFRLAEDAVGKSIFELFTFLGEDVRSQYETVFATGKTLVTEETNALYGEFVTTETRKIPIIEDNQITRVVTIVRDVTDRTRAEAALRESEQRFRTIADFTYDWEYWLGADGQLMYISPSCEATTGYKPDDFRRDPDLLAKIVHPDDRAIRGRHLLADTTDGKATSVDFRIITKDGAERWINHVCQAVFSSEGEYLGRRASNRDITDRKLAEQALRRERDRAQRYLDVAGTVLLAIDKNQKVILINKKGSQILGYDETEILGANWFDRFIPFQWRESTRIAFCGLMDKGSTNGHDYRETPVLVRNGDERIIAWHDTVLYDESGNPRGTLSSGSDITDRRHMEQVQAALFAISEATLNSQSLEELLSIIHQILGGLIDTTNFYVALYDGEHDQYTFPYLVDQYHSRADLHPEQLKKTLTDYVRRTGRPLLADENTDRELRARGEVDVVGQPSQIWLGVPLVTQRGTIGVVAVQSYADPTLYKESDMDLMTFVSRHITIAIERKLSEEALRESEEHHRSLLETMNEGLMIRDNDNNITFANNKMCEMLGYSRDEIIGRGLSVFLDRENRLIMEEQLQQRQLGGRQPYELEFTRRDGRKVTTIVSPELVKDAVGNIVGSFAVITNITEHKRTEEKLRQATDLLRTEREALTQKNIALKEILDHLETERKDYKQTICSDVERAISPILTRAKILLGIERAADIEALESQLTAILAKDIDDFRNRYSTLTPREFEICDMIRSNHSSKEISERLNLSLLTVHKHREQIRRKLGITSKGINLSTYLQSH